MPIKYVDCRVEKVDKVEKVIKGKNGYRVRVTTSTTKDCKPVVIPMIPQQVQKEQHGHLDVNSDADSLNEEPGSKLAPLLEVQKIRTHLARLFPELLPPFARLLRNLSH